jgi:hypothetical protein
MKGLLLIFLIVLVVGTVSAQEIEEPLMKNTIFLELAGNGGFYSLNYDRILLEKAKWKLAGRIGAMYYREELNYLDYNHSLKIAVPIEASYLRGKGDHYLELGIGMTPWYENYKDFDASEISHIVLLSSARLGYRYQKKEGGMFLKAGFTPLLQFKNKVYENGSSIFFPWGGLAIGFTLKN